MKDLISSDFFLSTALKTFDVLELGYGVFCRGKYTFKITKR